MATQAERVQELLIQRLETYYSGRSVAPGSSLYDTVVTPVANYLGVDATDTDIAEFLKTRLRQEYPSVSAENGDAIVDLLINPLSLLLEALKRETALIKLGQSVQTAASMRDSDADALAANFFVARRVGGRAYGLVRIYYANPTSVFIGVNTRFTTSGGLAFQPTTSQNFPAEQLLLQRAGNYYYVDVSLISAETGTQYNIAANTLTNVTGLTGYIKFTNLAAFAGAADRETNVELLTRVRSALTERSLNTRRGIVSRIQGQFPSVRSVEVVGYGDPEMRRDVVTGSSEGHAVASGTCFIVGQFCLMLSQFEDRGRDGSTTIKPGDTIALNYWNLLYSLPQAARNEEFKIADIVFDTRDTLPDIPSILLFRLSSAPSPESSTLGMLPGMLPGVFCVVRSNTKITISGIPGGIQAPQTPAGELEIFDNEVHIGGHYDVWLRPSVDQSATATFGQMLSNSSVTEGRQLATFGGEDTGRNVVSIPYSVSFRDGFSSTSTIFTPGTSVVGARSGATATVATTSIIRATGSVTLTAVTGAFEVGEEITNVAATAGGTITYVSSDLQTLGARAGMTLVLLTGADVGSYRILDVVGESVYLDTDLTESETQVHFRVLSEITEDMFAPKVVLVPFADALGDDLSTVVGSQRLRLTTDLQQYGVVPGDSIEIFGGNDAGVYTIQSFDAVLGGIAPIVSSAMSASNSRLPYRVYRAATGVQRPFVRIKPEGVRLLDSAGKDANIVVPYALPLGAYALGDFSGAKEGLTGRNGFVLPDPGTSWTPTADLTASRDEFADALACYSDECIPCDGYIAVVTLMANGQFYLNSNMPTAVKEFFRNMQNWLLNVVDQFNIGPDAKAFIHGLTPITFGSPVDAIEFTSEEGTLRSGETLTVGAVSATISDIEQELVVSSTVGFKDGETITQGDMTASIRVTSLTTLSLTAISGPASGAFEVGTPVTGGTTGTVATPTEVRGRLVVAGTTGGSLATGNEVLAAATGVHATITILVVPVAQFEICLPGEMFDGCNNVFVALPEFDWEALLATTDTFAEAISKYTTGQLLGPPPALATAKPGDVVSLLAGANEGQYSVHSVKNYKVGTAGAIVSGTADFTKFYPVTAVVIDGEFPVAAFGDLASFFADGIPELAALPVPNDFPGIAYDETGMITSPWDWIGQFLTWLFRFLDSMGFDLPETFSIDPAETIKTLWQMLFTEYRVGRRTAEQTIRLYFQEPTSVSVYGPRPCRRFIYDDPVRTAASLEYDVFAVENAGGEVLRVEVRSPYARTLGTFTAEADDLDLPPAELAALIQEQVDPSAAFVTVTVGTNSLIFTSVELGQDITLLVDTADFIEAGAFTTGDPAAEGTTVVGPTTTQIYEPRAPTLFSVPLGAEQLLFTASADVAPARLFPSAQEVAGEDPPLLPRDCRIPTAHTDATALRLTFTEQDGESWFYRGLEQGDLFQLFEQKVMLKPTMDPAPGGALERFPALITTAGSASVRLPALYSPEFTFLTPSRWMDEDVFDSFDVVQAGDLVYIEEGDDTGVYRVSSRVSASELVLDRPLTTSSGTVYFSGNRSEVDVSDPLVTNRVVVRSVGGTLNSSYVGKYLTIWGSNYAEVDGSYEITAISAVDGGYQLTLADADFQNPEMGLHWAIVRAPNTAPADSALGGKTELVGVRPFRIYCGRAKEWPVVAVERTLDAASCSVLISIAEEITSSGAVDPTEPAPRAPRVGFRQPYGFVRNSAQHVSSTTMMTQREGTLYYFDVVAHSLDSRDLNNISKSTRLEPVFGTYDSDGYYLNVGDTNYTFSSLEQCQITLTPRMLPAGRDDTAENLLLIAGRRVAIQYQLAPAVAQVQDLLSSQADRVLCANPLARHFLPSYVSFSVSPSVVAEDAQLIATKIYDYIEGLSSTQYVELSKIEGVMQAGGVTDYPHPLYMYAVAHDLDRRLVLTKSESRIGDVVNHNGTNKITYYIPGPAGVSAPAGAGEAITVLTTGAATATLQ